MNNNRKKRKKRKRISVDPSVGGGSI